jgi:hypothetical protein
VVGASSGKRVLADEEVIAVQICGTDVDGVWLRWPTKASRVVEARAEQRQREEHGRAQARMRKGGAHLGPA